MSPPTLFLYVIHTQTLTQRALRVHGTIQELRTAAMQKGYDVKPFLITKHDPDELAPKIAELQKNVTYDEVGNADFDKLRQILSIEVISNIEKHKEAWKRTYEATSDNPRDLFMVLEDDAFLLPDSIQNFQRVLDALDSASWDIMFLGMSMNTPMSGQEAISFIPVKETAPNMILPTKESYLIKQQTARRLLDSYDKYRYSLRGQLSYMLYKAPEIRALHTTHRVTIDGSKLGIFPSAINPSNFLMFNKEYMELFQFLQQDKADVERALPLIRSIYKKIQHLQSPDIMHLYGVLLFKAGKVHDAEDVLNSAVEQMKAQQGLLNSRSDLMSNLINIYQHMQRDLSDLLKTKSVYDDAVHAEADAP